MSRLLIPLALTGALILGCAGLEEAAEQLAESAQPTPPPAGMEEFVGTWTGGPITLVITAEGSLAYEKSRGAGSTTLTAPVLSWQSDSITAGIGPMTRTFVVDAPPALQDGVGHMRIDGQDLTRQ